MRDLRLEPGLVAQPEEIFVEPRAQRRRIEHQRNRGEIGDRRIVGPVGERMPRAHRHHHIFLEDAARGEFVGQAWRADAAHQRDIEPAAAQRLDLRVARQIVERQLHLGIILPEAIEGGGDQRHERRRRGEADAQPPELAAPGEPRGLDRVIGLRQCRARLGDEQFARLGQPHAAAGAIEQPGAELILQRADLLAERGLRDAESLRGAAEMHLLGNAQEIAQMAKVQRSCPLTY